MSWIISVENEEVVIALTIDDEAASVALSAAARAEEARDLAEADAVATAADRVQTGLDADATAADRVQTGLDVQSASNSAAAALSSAQAADASEANALIFADNAAASAAAALISQNAAASSASAALISQQAAAGSASAALISQQAAAASANAAAASASAAAQVGTSTLLTGFSVGGNTAIAATDSILQAFNKTQGQLNARAVISGTPAAGQVAFWGSASAVVGDAGLSWDNTNKFLMLTRSTDLTTLTLLRFNTARPWEFRTVNEGALSRLELVDTTNGKEFRIVNTANVGLVFTPNINALDAITGLFQIRTLAGNGNIALMPNGSGSVGIKTPTPTTTLDVVGTGRIRNNVSLADTSGNVQIGTTTDAGFRLDVNGTARISGALTTNLTAGRVPFVGTAGVLSDSANLTWDNTNTRLGVGTNVPATILHILPASGSPVLRLERTSGAVIDLSASTLAFGGVLGTNSNSPLRFRTNNEDRLFISEAGSVLIGTTTAVASSLLTIESTTQGVLFPRMTSTQRNAISSPATGLVVYNTTDNRLSVFNGTAWVNISTL